MKKPKPIKDKDSITQRIILRFHLNSEACTVRFSLTERRAASAKTKAAKPSSPEGDAAVLSATAPHKSRNLGGIGFDIAGNEKVMQCGFSKAIFRGQLNGYVALIMGKNCTL